MKKYFLILLYTGSLFTASQNELNERVVLNQVHDASEKDPFSQKQGPDFFAKEFRKCAQENGVSNEDKKKYAVLAQRAERQILRLSEKAKRTVNKS